MFFRQPQRLKMVTKNIPIQEKIRNFRKKQGITQAQLAQRWGLNKSTICSWEQYTRTPSVTAIIERLIYLEEFYLSIQSIKFYTAIPDLTNAAFAMDDVSFREFLIEKMMK